MLSISQTIPCTEAEGPGKRFAVWVQGCPMRCQGCCNPEMQSFQGGTQVSVSELTQQAVASGVEGVSVLGGEPFAQAEAVAAFCEGVKAAGLGVWVFTGYELGQLVKMRYRGAQRLLAATDVLVDGPYRADLPEPKNGRRWVGSRNQAFHFLTDRYNRQDSRLYEPNTIEIRLIDNQVIINGFPHEEQNHEHKRNRPARGVERFPSC